MKFPVSPFQQVGGLYYFSRMCDKIRLFQSGELLEVYHKNLGKAMDLWTCQLLGVKYEDLSKQVIEGLTDEEALDWAMTTGGEPQDYEIKWWNSYMRNFGFQDDAAEKLALRIAESSLEDRGIKTFFEYIDADEKR